MLETSCVGRPGTAVAWRAGGRVFSLEHGEILCEDTEDSYRTAMRQMMGVFAQLERAVIVARMKAGRVHKAETGGYAYGASGYGQRAEGGALVADEREQAAVGPDAEAASPGGLPVVHRGHPGYRGAPTQARGVLAAPPGGPDVGPSVGSGSRATGSGSATSAATSKLAGDQRRRRKVAGSGSNAATPETPPGRGSGVCRAATATTNSAAPGRLVWP
jgi:hypothetical protein